MYKSVTVNSQTRNRLPTLSLQSNVSFRLEDDQCNVGYWRIDQLPDGSWKNTELYETRGSFIRTLRSLADSSHNDTNIITGTKSARVSINDDKYGTNRCCASLRLRDLLCFDDKPDECLVIRKGCVIVSVYPNIRVCIFPFTAVVFGTPIDKWPQIKHRHFFSSLSKTVELTCHIHKKVSNKQEEQETLQSGSEDSKQSDAGTVSLPGFGVEQLDPTTPKIAKLFELEMLDLCLGTGIRTAMEDSNRLQDSCNRLSDAPGTNDKYRRVQKFEGMVSQLQRRVESIVSNLTEVVDESDRITSLVVSCFAYEHNEEDFDEAVLDVLTG
eukprot:GHVL01014478.1.p1 GENE.GHVL01014478.1~~GHVL01014478.1.p1  ORF type:complete len:326 (+),score=47.61 GHVL01014478.1:173-1150(+)